MALLRWETEVTSPASACWRRVFAMQDDFAFDSIDRARTALMCSGGPVWFDQIVPARAEDDLPVKH